MRPTRISRLTAARGVIGPFYTALPGRGGGGAPILRSILGTSGSSPGSTCTFRCRASTMRHVSVRLDELTAQARALTSAGDLAAARSLLDAALAPVDADPLHASPAVADAAALHAQILLGLGEAYAAQPWADLAHTARRRLHGPADERTVAACTTLAVVLHRLGAHARAAALYAEVVRQLTRTEGPDSARVLAARADLAVAEHAEGLCHSARAHLTDAWRRYRAAFGEADPAGIKMLARLGAMERDCGLDTDAARHLAEAHVLCVRNLPPEHPLCHQVDALGSAPANPLHGGSHAAVTAAPARMLR